MITIAEEMYKRQDWSKNEHNKWADFIEYRCLCDEFVSASDVVAVISGEDIDNKEDRGGSEHHEKSDNLETVVRDYFELLRSRGEELEDYYPFTVLDDDTIQLKPLEEKHLIYFYLLTCSSIVFMDRSSSYLHTHNFETACKIVMKVLVADKAQVELFGTSKDEEKYTGNLRTRIEILAKDLGAVPTPSLNEDKQYDRIPNGDAGLDIVAYYPLDKSQYIPFCFAQCTCSYSKWMDKQDSIGYDDWNNLITPIPYYGKYMMVPFSCHNAAGRFENITKIHTFLIDRIRLLRIISSDEIAYSDFIMHCKDFITKSKMYSELLETIQFVL